MPRFDHRREDFLACPEHAGEIDPDGLLEHRRLERHGGREAAGQPGVGEQALDGTEMHGCGIQRRVELVLFPDIGREACGARADLGGDFLERFLAPGDQRDPRATAGQQLRGDEADPARSAGHHDVLAVKVHQVRPSTFAALSLRMPGMTSSRNPTSFAPAIHLSGWISGKSLPNSI